MKTNSIKKIVIAAAFSATCFLSVHAQGLFITEINPGGSGTGHGYTADWFEVTNTGSTSLLLTGAGSLGLKVDDDSNSFGSSLALRGVTTLLAGQSAIFLESTDSGAADAGIKNAFKSAWWGSVGAAPAGLLLGNYNGSGIGFGQGGDAVNIFSSTGALIHRFSFGAYDASSPFSTFDNTALSSGTVSLQSTVGINGAFLSANGQEIGSPGFAPIPEPSTYALILGLGAMGLVTLRRKLGLHA
jgi:Lamin Tail Domain/PEP-CTERM motif